MRVCFLGKLNGSKFNYSFGVLFWVKTPGHPNLKLTAVLSYLPGMSDPASMQCLPGTQLPNGHFIRTLLEVDKVRYNVRPQRFITLVSGTASPPVVKSDKLLIEAFAKNQG